MKTEKQIERETELYFLKQKCIGVLIVIFGMISQVAYRQVLLTFLMTLFIVPLGMLLLFSKDKLLSDFKVE